MTKLPVKFLFSSTESIDQLATLLFKLSREVEGELSDQAKEWGWIFQDFIKAQENPHIDWSTAIEKG